MEKELGDQLGDTVPDIELVPGNPGQFDVMMDGERIATRSKGWQRFLGGGWPTVEEVADAIRSRA